MITLITAIAQFAPHKNLATRCVYCHMSRHCSMNSSCIDSFGWLATQSVHRCPTYVAADIDAKRLLRAKHAKSAYHRQAKQVPNCKSRRSSSVSFDDVFDDDDDQVHNHNVIVVPPHVWRNTLLGSPVGERSCVACLCFA